MLKPGSRLQAELSYCSTPSESSWVKCLSTERKGNIRMPQQKKELMKVSDQHIVFCLQKEGCKYRLAQQSQKKSGLTQA